MLTKRAGSRSDLTRGMLVVVFNSKSNKGRMMDSKTEEPVNIEILQQGEIWKISINRPEARNCVDRYTADQLEKAFQSFETDATARVAILTGEGGNFCAGADLKAVASGDPSRVNRMERHGAGPMGIMVPTKPSMGAMRLARRSGSMRTAAVRARPHPTGTTS